MKYLVILFLACGLILAGLLGVTLSLPLQSLALVSFGVAGIFVSFLVLRGGQGWKLPVFFLVCWAYFIVRCVLSPVPDLAMEDLFLIMSAGLVYLTMVWAGDTPASRMVGVGVVSLLLVLHLGSAVSQMFGSDGFSLAAKYAKNFRSEDAHITGMYSYIGSFANYVSIAGVVALSLGVWGRFPLLLRILFMILGFLAVVFTVISMSRGAVIGLAVGIVVLLVLLWISFTAQHGGFRRKMRGGVFALGLMGMAATCVAGAWVFKNRAQKSEGVDMIFDSDVRLAYWAMAAEQWSDYPLVGAGSRSYSYQCFKYWSPNLDTGEANPEFAHNEYLQVLADYGLLGFLLLLAFILTHMIIGVQRIRKLSVSVGSGGFSRGSTSLALAIAGVTGMAIMLIHVIFDFRTHLQANLLLLVMCLVWVLPLNSIKRSEVKSPDKWHLWLVATCLLITGLVSVYMGVTEFKGGLPLLSNQLAHEHGAWSPDEVYRDGGIDPLKKSVSIAPSYRRYLKLGMLHRMEGERTANIEKKTKDLRRAMDYYLMAAERHPYEAVSRLNLASLHTYFKEYQKADKYFGEVDKLASSRERWFSINHKWADMQRQSAGSEWMAGNLQTAAKHYDRALEVVGGSEVRGTQMTSLYFMILVDYTRLLAAMESYEKADALYGNAEKNLPSYAINSLNKNIRREMGEHYLRYAKHLWFKRRPEEAIESLKQADRCLTIHRVLLKGRKDDRLERYHREVREIMVFLKNAGFNRDEPSNKRGH